MPIILSRPRVPVVTSPVVRSPFSRRTIAGLECWLDFADARTITLGTGISQIRDKSGNNRHASQTVAARQPAYPGSIGTMRAATFTAASNHFLTFGQSTLGNFTLAADTGNAWTFFIVATTAVSGFQCLLSRNLTATGSQRTFALQYNNTGSVFQFNVRGTSNNTSPFTVGTPDILSAVYQAGGSPALSVGVDGTYTSGTVGTATIENVEINIGTRFNGNLTSFSASFSGQVGEFLAYGRALTTIERQYVEAYLAWKWGITSLPVDHPYKNTPLRLRS